MPLVNPDLTYNRPAIRAFARAEHASPFRRPGQRFVVSLKYAFRTAQGLRERLADGTHARMQREAAEREAALQALVAVPLSDAVSAWIALQCSTDGRLSAERRP